MHYHLVVARPRVAIDLLVDYFNDTSRGMAGSQWRELDRALRDEDVPGTFAVLGWTSRPGKLPMQVELHPAKVGDIDVLRAIAPSMVAGSFLIWQDAQSDLHKAVVVEAGHLVELVQVGDDTAEVDVDGGAGA